MIELAKVITDLRSELGRAVAAGESEQLRFELGPIELEVTLVVEHSKDGSGKISFWVVEAGTDRTNSSATTQRIKLALTPRLANTEGSIQIAGTPEPGER